MRIRIPVPHPVQEVDPNTANQPMQTNPEGNMFVTVIVGFGLSIFALIVVLKLYNWIQELKES